MFYNSKSNKNISIWELLNILSSQRINSNPTDFLLPNQSICWSYTSFSHAFLKQRVLFSHNIFDDLIILICYGQFCSNQWIYVYISFSRTPFHFCHFCFKNNIKAKLFYKAHIQCLNINVSLAVFDKSINNNYSIENTLFTK